MIKYVQKSKKITDKAYNDSLQIIKENIDLLHLIANQLVEKETIDNKELEEIFKTKKSSI